MGVKNDIIKMSQFLCKDAVKEVKKSKRQRRSFNRAYIYVPRETPKLQRIRDHLLEAYQRASGNGVYLTTARQVFYALREILNVKHEVELKQSDYGTFTQERLTEFFESNPGFETKILFDRRGFFKDPFFDEELPLGTLDVVNFMKKVSEDRIYTKQIKKYDIPIKLQYNHVLFIEKAGFDIILKDSGLIDELNLGILSTQGFGTRAVKKLMRYFINSGIKVYVLHDCDIAGYLIKDKFLYGSRTYKSGLSVTDIGISVSDIKEIGKESSVEDVSYGRNYTEALNMLSADEREFFVIDGYSREYRRLEINALTTEELLDFIKSKISYKPIKPAVEQLEKYIEIDKSEVIKNALYNVFGNKFDFTIDEKELAEKINEEINGETHWTKTLEDLIDEFCQKKEKEVQIKINEIIKI